MLTVANAVAKLTRIFVPGTNLS